MSRTPVEAADALFEAGNPRAALEVLRAGAVRDRPPFVVRRRLAEIYRAWGYPDEAGRWGIVLEGWTTPRERDRLARSITARRVPSRFRRAHLAIPPDVPDTQEAREVLTRLVPAMTHRRASEARSTPVRRARRLRWFAVRALSGAIGVALIGGVAVFIWALMGVGRSARDVALNTAEIIAPLLVVGAITSVVARIIERRPVAAIVFCVLAVGVGTGFAAVASMPGGLFDAGGGG